MAEKPVFVFPVCKSPFTKGRIGEARHQDWFQGLKKAVRLSKKLRAKTLVISGFTATGSMSEADCYRRALCALGNGDDEMVLIRQGQETTEELEIAINLAEEENAKLVVVSTLFHYPRVRWICRGKKAEHHMAIGLPRPKEMITDIILWFVYPIIEKIGKKDEFTNWLKNRRDGGKL
jgi:vancomycin permeability regulator SanA